MTRQTPAIERAGSMGSRDEGISSSAAMAANAWIVLLRGVNLGPNKRIAMADFRRELEALGYRNVRTHIVSGNAIVAGGRGTGAARERAIAKRLREELDLDVTVMVRTARELEAIVASNPFADSGTEPGRLHVLFLDKQPAAAAVKSLNPKAFAPDRFAFGDRVIYLQLPNGVAGSKLPNWEKVLGVRATMRNWNVTKKLRELAEEITKGASRAGR